jgi:hypothetical protein
MNTVEGIYKQTTFSVKSKNVLVYSTAEWHITTTTEALVVSSNYKPSGGGGGRGGEDKQEMCAINHLHTIL